MSTPQYRIRRVFVNAGAAEDILTPEQIAASEPKSVVTGYTPLGREPQTKEEMTSYLNAKKAGLPVVAPEPVRVAAAPHVKGHFTMPKNRPDWVKKHHDGYDERRKATLALRQSAPAPAAKPVLKIVAPDGKVHSGTSLQAVAKSVVGVVKKTVVPAAKPVAKPQKLQAKAKKTGRK